MAIKSRAVSVATTATQLDSASADGRPGKSLAFFNNGAATIYFGASNVTTANGIPVAAGAWSPAFDVADDEPVYGIVASGTVEARVLETGV